MDTNLKHPAITVFMAAYNSEAYIADSIRSVLDQTFHDFELLIVNDGSTDRTAEIVNEIIDPRIRLIQNDGNRGIPYTRNVALKEAKGEYIAILDSDDVAAPDRLALQYNFFLENPHFALCGAHGESINHEGSSVQRAGLSVPTDPQKIRMTLLFTNTFVNSTTMFKTAVFRELGGYKDYALAEDYDLFIRISDKYPANNLDRILVKYRVHESNITKTKLDICNSNLREIKKNQLISLNIEPDQLLIETMFNVLMWAFKPLKIKDYLNLFIRLKTANYKLKKYPVPDFEKMLFEKWYEVIISRKAKMNALPLLFNSGLFKWSYINAKKIRKVFKLSIKGIGTLSR